MKHTATPDAAREYHYWRGFRSALIAVSPIVIILAYACELALSALTK